MQTKHIPVACSPILLPDPRYVTSNHMTPATRKVSEQQLWPQNPWLLPTHPHTTCGFCHGRISAETGSDAWLSLLVAAPISQQAFLGAAD